MYKNTEDETLRLNRYLKFSMARKKIKDLVSLKMKQNVDDNDDFGLITKKFGLMLGLLQIVLEFQSR